MNSGWTVNKYKPAKCLLMWIFQINRIENVFVHSIRFTFNIKISFKVKTFEHCCMLTICCYSLFIIKSLIEWMICCLNSLSINVRQTLEIYLILWQCWILNKQKKKAYFFSSSPSFENLDLESSNQFAIRVTAEVYLIQKSFYLFRLRNEFLFQWFVSLFSH